MTMPFYVPAEQIVKDRAEFAQKGIARGRSLVALIFQGGVLLVAENPSSSLNKISEIYDRIGFGGVGRYNEFDRLREAGVRWADLTGFQYAREDVDAQELANVYAQYLGSAFSEGPKPLEVEVLVAEIGERKKPSKIYHVAYEGTITDERQFAVIGGDAETIRARLATSVRDNLSLSEALTVAVTALAGEDRTLQADDLEVAALESSDRRRKFRKFSKSDIATILQS
jgi:proteasome alpha subunit